MIEEQSNSSLPDDPDAKIQALEARTLALEEMAFSYAVLAEVSRAMNTFLIAEELISFALEIIIECAGFTKGLMLVYSRTHEVLTVKACKLFTQKAPRILEPLSNEEILNQRFRVNPDIVRELELSGTYIFILTPSVRNPLIAKAFPGLLEVLELHNFEVALLLVHRGELKGAVLMGERIIGSMFQVEGNLLLLALADLTATCLANIHFRELAIIDDLTRVYTHGYFKELLEHEIERSSCLGDACALILLDVDKFKMINDHYGHITGDKVLKRVAVMLQGAVRDKVDLVSRYGGDEFLVLLPSTEPGDAQMIGERIRSQVARNVMEKVGNITISVGITFFPSHGTSIEELIEQADKALYKAKREGGNQVITIEDVEFQTIDTARNPTIYRLFIRDKTTKFYVGPYFLDRLDQELRRAKRYHRTFSLVAFGLSFEKKPEMEDEKRRMEDLLRIVCLSILARIRKGIDLTTRYSKEKVLFLLPETGQEGAIQFVNRIRQLLNNQLNQIKKEWGNPKLCVGIAAYPEGGENQSQLFDRLLQALDQVVSNEGNQIGVCNGEQIRLIPMEVIQQLQA